MVEERSRRRRLVAGLGSTLILASGGSLGVQQYVERAFSAAITEVAQDYGLEVEGEWSVHLLGARVRGRDLSVSADVPLVVASQTRFSDKAMLSVDEAELDASWLSLLRGRAQVRRLTLRDVELIVERAPDGRWNWSELLGRLQGMRADLEALVAGVDDAGARADAARRREAPPEFRIAEILVEELDVEWIEHRTTPDGATRADRVSLDDARIRLVELRSPMREGFLETQLEADAEVGNGRLVASGAANFLSAPPLYQLRLQLDGVPGGAFSFLSKASQLVLQGGALSGGIELVRTTDAEMSSCRVTTRSVGFSLSPHGGGPELSAAQLRELSGAAVDSEVRCGVVAQRVDDPKRARLLATVQTQVTLDVAGAESAPPIAGQVAKSDYEKVVDALGETVATRLAEKWAEDLGTPLAGALGDSVGSAVGNLLKPEAEPSEGSGAPPVASGPEDKKSVGETVRSGLGRVGQGFRGFFGGGDDDE